MFSIRESSSSRETARNWLKMGGGGRGRMIKDGGWDGGGGKVGGHDKQ
jgi:hypothetical protein